MAEHFTAAELRMWELGREAGFYAGWAGAMESMDTVLALALERTGHGYELPAASRAAALDLFRRYLGLGLTPGGLGADRAGTETGQGTTPVAPARVERGDRRSRVEDRAGDRG